MTLYATDKPHPKDRPVEPEDPMNLHAVEAPGDPEIMLRCLVEEYARMGWGLDELMALCRDPFYAATFGLKQLYGEEELRRRIGEILARAGVMRVRTTTSEPPPKQIVEIEAPGAQED